MPSTAQKERQSGQRLWHNAETTAAQVRLAGEPNVANTRATGFVPVANYQTQIL